MQLAYFFEKILNIVEFDSLELYFSADNTLLISQFAFKELAKSMKGIFRRGGSSGARHN
jgi:hypothetical protein